MKTSLWRKFPKWALAAAIVVVSTGLFAFWWFFLYPRWRSSPGTPSASTAPAPGPPAPDEWEQRAARAETLPDHMGSLVVAGNDLYDIQTGELIFKNWLSGGCPPLLYYDAANRKIIGRLEKGLIRYDLTGKKNAVIGEPTGAAFTDGYQLALFARNGNLWKAKPDWRTFSLTGELQVTKGGVFNDAFLSQNIRMGSENVVFVHQPPNLLRVDLNTGDMIPARLPPGSSFKNQSPDGRLLAGMLRERNQQRFYIFDVDKDEPETFETGRKGVGDILWLRNDRCAVILNGGAIHLYDRKRKSFEPVIQLPVAVNKALGPSPDGKRFFCGSRQNALLIDVEAKTAEFFKQPAENMEWVTGDAILYACTAPNTAIRGTWFQRMGTDPVRVLEEPYAFSRDGKSCAAVLPRAEYITFGTASGLYRMSTAGSKLEELGKWRQPPGTMTSIDVWKPE